MNLPASRQRLRTSRGVRHALRKILKNRVFLLPFPAFWSVFSCIEKLMNEKKVLGILMKKTYTGKLPES